MFKTFEATSILTEQKEKGGIKKITSYIPYGFQWFLFDKIGLYATSPGRVLISVVFFWFCFGLSYYVVELIGLGQTISAVNNPDNLSMLTQSFYHAAITFFTIGYGDTYPTGLSRIIASFEGFMGVFMMSTSL